MIGHFDFFGFYNNLLIIACDVDDKVMGYAVLRDNNEICEVFVKPDYRNRGLVHILMWKCVEIAKELGEKILWGTMYDHRKELYMVYKDLFGATLIKVVPPEEREDGKWTVVYDITTITPDRRPRLR